MSARYADSPLHAEAQRAEWCWCGEPPGHVDWLECLDREARRRLTPPRCECGLNLSIPASVRTGRCYLCREATDGT